MVESGLYVHFSSGSNSWETPQGLFDKLNEEFHFELDVCATSEHAKCKKYYSPEEDGLKQEWKGICWMNPPYGREIRKWMKKAYESALAGATVVVWCQQERIRRGGLTTALKGKSGLSRAD